MSRVILTGAPRALVEALARQIRLWRRADAFGCVIVLAPRGAVATALRDELPLAMRRLRHDGACGAACGLFNVEIEALTSWAAALTRPRMLREGRSPLPRWASLAVTAYAIRSTKPHTSALAAGREGDDPRDRPNFHHAILSELINLKKAGWTPDDVVSRCGHRFRREMRAIYAEAEAILHDGRERRWADPSDSLGSAVDEVATLDEMAGVALFGFTALNDLEQALVRAMAERRTPQAAFIPYLDDAPAFALPAALVRTLEELWQVRRQAAGADTPEPPALPLVRDLFRTDRAPLHDIPAISLASAPDPVREWQDVARWVWERVRAEPDLRWSDVHVLAPNLQAVWAIARDVFADAGIPLHRMGGTPLIESDAGRSLIQFLDVAESGLARSAVMELLTTCPLPDRWLRAEDGRAIPPTEWDRIARLAGIVGGLGRGQTAEEEWLARLRRFAARIQHRIENRQADWDGEDVGESRERLELDLLSATALIGVIGELIDCRERIERAQRPGGRDGWARWVAAVREGWTQCVVFPSDDAAGGHGDALARVGTLLDEIAGYDAVVPLVPPGTCRRLLVDALTETRLPMDPSSEEGVWIGELREERYRGCRAVAITGLVDPEFPAPQQRTALALLPPEMVPCATGDGQMSELDRNVAQDRLSYAMALVSATKHVRISYPRAKTGEEEPHLPSPVFFDTLRRLVPPPEDGSGRPRAWEEKTLRAGIDGFPRGRWLVRRPIPEAVPGCVYLNVEEFELAWAGALRGTDAGREWIARLSVPAPRAAPVRFAERGLRLLAARAAGRFSGYDGWISDPALAARIRDEFRSPVPISPSKLEAYAACPFRYFARYVLRLEPLPEPVYEDMLDDRTSGSLLHALLARFFRALKAGRQPLGAIPPKECRARFSEVADAYRAALAASPDIPAPIVWEAQWATICRRAWRAVEAAMKEAHRWEPRYMELGLGVQSDRVEPESSAAAIVIDLPDHGRVALRGIIDRVDFGADGTSARIVDYKWGRAPTGLLPRLDAGRQVQLVVYAKGLADYLVQAGDPRQVVEASYHYLREPMPASATPADRSWPLKPAAPEGLDLATEQLCAVLDVMLAGIRDGIFAPVPHAEPSRQHSECSRCEVAPACGSPIDLAGRWEGLLGAEKLLRLRTLRERNLREADDGAR